VPGENGIRRSKDLRAEIGKFPNSTNERKKMSKKTIKQRIALIAVSALTAGVLSVASAPVASANGALSNTNNSVGVLAGTSIVSGTTTTHTATMLTTGTLNLTYGGASSVVVSAGGRIASASTTANIAASQQAAYNVTSVGIVVTGAVGSTFTVSGYSQTTAATVAAAAPTSVMTVTIASSSVAGVPAVSESTFRWATGITNVPTASESVDNATDDYASNNLFLYIDLEDAYGADVTNASGALVVTASAGATVGNPAASSAAAGTTNVGILATDPSRVWAVVKSATAGAPWNGTVTVAYNGVTLATLAGTITGAPSKITLTPYKAGKSGSNAAGFLYKVTDSAGNGLAFTSSNLNYESSSNSAVVSTASGGATDAAYGGAYGDYVGSGNFTCGQSGTSDVVMSLVISGTGTVVKSAPATLRCAGAAFTYTASLDKASYVQGEIATMTVTFRDSAGNLANSYDAVDAVTGSGASGVSNASISAPMLALVGSVNSTAATTNVTAKPGLAGTRTYTFTVGTASGLTAGSYNAVVDFPTVTALSSTKAATVAYKVTTGGSAVTNEDVLKSIVSLIASINKQIQALQKLILRR
jgi:hypothetical protein